MRAERRDSVGHLGNRIRLLCAFDKFKGTLEAEAAGHAALTALGSPADARVVALSDGGEGFVSCLAPALSLELVEVEVEGPRGAPVRAQAAVGGGLGVLEMSQCAGLMMLEEEERDPAHTSTYGVGQCIKELIKLGATEIICGIGGSATNDGGVGALQALGVGVGGTKEHVCGRHLEMLEKLTPMQEPLGVRIRCACDVTTPFLEAVRIFSAQKGATPESMPALQRGMERVAELFSQNFGKDVTQVPGAGAAGGLAGGLWAGAGATLESGVDIVSDVLGLEEHVRQADVVLTGEGHFDEQTDEGKAVSKVLELCKKHNKPCWVVCGHASGGRELQDNVLSLTSRFDRDKCMNDAEACLQQLIEENKSLILYMPGRKVRKTRLTHCARGAGPNGCRKCIELHNKGPVYQLIEEDSNEQGATRMIEQFGGSWSCFKVVRTFETEEEAAAFAQERGIECDLA